MKGVQHMLKDILKIPETNIFVVANGYHHYDYFIHKLHQMGLIKSKIGNIGNGYDFRKLRGKESFIIFLSGWTQNFKTRDLDELDIIISSRKIKTIKISDQINKEDFIKELTMDNKNGSYDLEGVIWHQHSNLLMAKILQLWPDKNIPVVDLGCGMNYYCSVFEFTGYGAIGIDGACLKGVDMIEDITKIPNPPAFPGLLDLVLLQHGRNKVSNQFFIKAYRESRKVNVLSLEVGEHLPPNLSDAYINNLTSFGGDIIMSWAIPGQAGVGHINCQSNEWVIDKMFERGYILDPGKTHQLRESVTGCHCSWFKNTLMYFNPKAK